jgi:hypothetical protein
VAILTGCSQNEREKIRKEPTPARHRTATQRHHRNSHQLADTLWLILDKIKDVNNKLRRLFHHHLTTQNNF